MIGAPLEHRFAASVREKSPRTNWSGGSRSHRRRWSYIEGSSRRRLPALIRSLARVDLFIHDSLHTVRNMRFEMEQTLKALARGGIMIVDDMSTHQAFANFARDFPSLETAVCPHSDRAESFFGLVHKAA